MPEANIFRWMDGRGLLVLSGGADDEIRASALGRSAADGGIAYLTMSGSLESGERTLEEMEDLGAPSGYVVDVATEDDQTVTARLADAGMIVIESAPSAADARSLLLGAAAEGILTAYQNGAVILTEGLSAMAFGQWVTKDDGTLVNGLEWVESALIAPGVTDVADWARGVLQTQPAAFAVGIATGSALALDGDGNIETWGNRQVTVALGRSFTSSRATGE